MDVNETDASSSSSKSARPTDVRRLASFLCAALFITSSAACSKEQGNDFICSCTFLTDFDDGSSVDVAVCSPSLERAGDFARGCSQSAASAPIDKCVCKLERANTSCDVGACVQRAREP